MNLNEKCLLKYLTNPISISNTLSEQLGNVIKKKDFNFGLEKTKNNRLLTK